MLCFPILNFNWGPGVLLVRGLSVAYLVIDIMKPQVPTDACGSVVILRLAITVLDIFHDNM